MRKTCVAVWRFKVQVKCTRGAWGEHAAHARTRAHGRDCAAIILMLSPLPPAGRCAGFPAATTTRQTPAAALNGPCTRRRLGLLPAQGSLVLFPPKAAHPRQCQTPAACGCQRTRPPWPLPPASCANRWCQGRKGDEGWGEPAAGWGQQRLPHFKRPRMAPPKSAKAGRAPCPCSAAARHAYSMPWLVTAASVAMVAAVGNSAAGVGGWCSVAAAPLPWRQTRCRHHYTASELDYRVLLF
jgi:hypothetical protein